MEPHGQSKGISAGCRRVHAIGRTGASLAGCCEVEYQELGAVNEKVTLPTYVRYQGATPDLRRPTPAYSGISTLSGHPKRCTEGKPGSGGAVSVLFAIYGAVRRLPGNKYWAALNSALGVDLKLQMILSGNMVEGLRSRGWQ